VSSLISLREVQSSDKDRMRDWRNSENVRPYMYSDHVISAQEHAEWFEKMLLDDTKKYWIIELEKTPVGVVNLTNIDLNSKCCDWAFYIFDPNTRGKGVGSFVEKSVLKYVFDDLSLEKLNCEVLETNPGVVKMHQKFGFVQEGFFRKAIRKKDQLVGIHRLSMLREEYYETKREKTSIDRDLEIIDKIQKIRSKNNINWMDILRLCLKENNKEAKKIIANINSHDSEISKLVEELSKNE
jgi:UDP-4-amino-4,6-dideoxy-N-acetyl-beta-L-altrosamine N-acetyltransferase